MRLVKPVLEMTDENFLRHMEIVHGANRNGSKRLWDLPHLRAEDVYLLDSLHSAHHEAGEAITCLLHINHEHEV